MNGSEPKLIKMLLLDLMKGLKNYFVFLINYSTLTTYSLFYKLGLCCP